MGFAKRDDGGMVGKIECGDLGMLGNARISWRGVELSTQRRLRQLPRQCMFASARPQQQDIHGFPFRAL